MSIDHRRVCLINAAFLGSQWQFEQLTVCMSYYEFAFMIFTSRLCKFHLSVYCKWTLFLLLKCNTRNPWNLSNWSNIEMLLHQVDQGRNNLYVEVNWTVFLEMCKSVFKRRRWGLLLSQFLATVKMRLRKKKFKCIKDR